LGGTQIHEPRKTKLWGVENCVSPPWGVKKNAKHRNKKATCNRNERSVVGGACFRSAGGRSKKSKTNFGGGGFEPKSCRFLLKKNQLDGKKGTFPLGK